MDTPTWRSAAQEAARLAPADEEALDVIGRLPFVTISQLLALSGRSPRGMYTGVARLAERGLIHALPGPAYLARSHRRLFLISNLGLAVLAWRRQIEPVSLARAWGLDRAPLRAQVGQLPALLSVYALLELLAGTEGGRVRLKQWSRPWRWRSDRNGAGPVQRVTLPAYTALSWQEDSGTCVERRYLLVADTGGMPPMALRRQLVSLDRLKRTTPLAVPTLVIATTSERRVIAWRALLDGIRTSRRYGARLDVEVGTWESWSARARMELPWPRVHTDVEIKNDAAPLATRPLRNVEDVRWPWMCVPRPINVPQLEASVRHWNLAPRDRVVLDVLGRHPFLSDRALADVLGRRVRWARSRYTELIGRGLARMVETHEHSSPLQGKHALVEVSIEGLRLLAGYAGLSLTTAVRYHGLTGGGPRTPVGPRRALLANPAHTLGGDAVFVAIARAARAHRNGALTEWRNAAACVHGRMRPDGYGLLRLGRREYGFFLEFDRGTVRPGALRAKFVAYHRYRASARGKREYDGFPTILVVTHGPGAEDRLADAVLTADCGQARPLHVLLTTVELLARVDGGPLGTIWRVPGRPGRRHTWPESGPTR